MATDLNTLILNTIKSDSKYGLEIIDEIKSKTNGAIILKQPSLYSALRRLETKGYVSSYWKDSELGGKRHYYQATKLGIDALNNKIKFQDAAEEYINAPEPKKEIPSKNDDEDKVFPNIRPHSVNTGFSDDEFDEDEPELDEQSSINYKTILGDFLTDDDESDEDEPIVQLKYEQPKKIETQKQSKVETFQQKEMQTQNERKEADTQSNYIKELQTLFKSDVAKKPEQTQSSVTQKTPTYAPPQQQTKLPDKKEMDFLENMAKKYNENFAGKNETAEDVEINLVEKINQKKKMGTFGIQRNETKYLLINQMNYISGLCIFFVNIAIFLTMFLLYLFKGWISLDKYIILGAALFCSIVMVLVNIVALYKFPDNRINYNFKWGKSLLIRFIIFALLFVFIVAVNLLVGMESLSSMFMSTYLFRWFVPSVLVFNIILRLIINYILSKQPKFQTTKEQNK